MWLSVVQRPLLPYELWVVMMIESHPGVENIDGIENLLTDLVWIDDHTAASSLRELFGNLITFTKRSHRYYVSLSDSELRTYFEHLGNGAEEEGLREPAFSTSEAHAKVASTCMAICAATTLYLVHAHDGTTDSTLTLYAWRHWHRHLTLSRLSLNDQEPTDLFEEMIYRVSTDLLLFLVSLNDILVGPITLPVTAGPLGCASQVYQAQKALERPLRVLSAITCSELFKASKHSGRTSVGSSFASHLRTEHEVAVALPERFPRRRVHGGDRRQASSKTETLRIDGLLQKNEHLLRYNTRQIVCGFSELARGLRAVCISLASPTLYDQVKTRIKSASPMDILVNAADWAEAVASYAYSKELPTEQPYSRFTISDMGDENYHAARFVRRQLAQTPEELWRDQTDELEIPADGGSTTKPADISALRWHATQAVYRLKGPRASSGPNSTFTINDSRLLSRTPALSPLTAHLYTPSRDPFRQVSTFIPKYARQFFCERISSLPNPILSSGFAASMHKLVASTPHDWTQLKSALLVDGYRVALLQAVIAILIHHIRRTLTPWLGAFIFYHPMEDLRLALSNPDVFLGQTLSYSWSWAVFSIFQNSIVDTMAILVTNFLLLNTHHLRKSTATILPGARTPLSETLTTLCKIAYGVYTLMIRDYTFCWGLHTISCLIALSKLLLGGESEHLALTSALTGHWAKALLLACMGWYYTRHALVPTLRGAVGSALSGRPGLLLVLAGGGGVLAGMVRWRARLYLAIELSPMFIVFGLVGVAVVMLAVEFVRDPLGLERRTMLMRRLGGDVRNGLPDGVGERGERVLARGEARIKWK
jgi:hypothetical protein